MKELATIDRHWTIIRVLSSRDDGATVQELAQAARVSEKTIRRDLAVMRRIGLPLSETVGIRNAKHWKMDSNRFLPAALRWDEAAALYMSKQLMQPLAGTMIAESFHELTRKIELALSNKAKLHLDRITKSIQVRSDPSTDHQPRKHLLDNLQLAVEEQRLTWITYQSQAATEPVTHDVHPYALVFAKNSFYLVAFAPHHQEVRHYKLDRISQVDVQPLKFPKPLDFNLDQHFAGSWSIYRGRPGTKPFPVRVRFTAEVSRYIQEKRWHASQILTPQRDGSLIAEFQLTATEEIKAWVLSFGAKAEVLEPESLREEISQELIQALVAYQVHSESTPTTTSRKRRSPK